MLSSLDIYYQYKPALLPSSFNNVIISAKIADNNLFYHMTSRLGVI